jgi:hypothetical protein
MMLVAQAERAAELLEGAEWAGELGRDHGAKLHITDERGVATYTIHGDTDEARRRDARKTYVHHLVVEELSSPVGDDYGVLGRQEMLRVLEDPLAPETRVTRRNLSAVIGLAFVVVATGETPTRIPGFEISLAAQRPAVIGLLCVLLVYQLIAFLIYVNTDVARRRAATAQVNGDASRLRTAFATVERLMPVADEADYGDSVKRWLAHAKSEARAFGLERHTAKARVLWDIAVPAALGLVALGFLLFSL